MLLTGLTGIGASVIGASLGREVVNKLGTELVSSLELVSLSLDRLEGSLLLVKTTMFDVGEGLVTVETTVRDLERSIAETQPLLQHLDSITSEQLPDSLDSVQRTMPSLVQVSGIIDDTLTRLSDFRIDRRILGVQIQFDLGINYDPEIPFDESVRQVGSSLDGLSDQLRALKQNIETSTENLDLLGQDLDSLAADLNVVNGRISEMGPLLDEYLRLVEDLSVRAIQIRNSIDSQLERAKSIVTLFAIWMGLTQLAPLYLGWELARGRRLR
jgi:methyl-accepting chemotaxis protein